MRGTPKGPMDDQFGDRPTSMWNLRTPDPCMAKPLPRAWANPVRPLRCRRGLPGTEPQSCLMASEKRTAVATRPEAMRCVKCGC